VTNVGERSVSVIDTQTLTVTATILVGSRPWNIIFNRAGTIAIVSCAGSNFVDVIDTATRAVIKTVPTGEGPFFSTYNGDESKLYISNSGANHAFAIGSVTIINVANYRVITNVTLQRQPFDLVFVNP
jgi:YVTN family beta-propeller protein